MGGDTRDEGARTEDAARFKLELILRVLSFQYRVPYPSCFIPFLSVLYRDHAPIVIIPSDTVSREWLFVPILLDDGIAFIGGDGSICITTRMPCHRHVAEGFVLFWIKLAHHVCHIEAIHQD